MTKLHNFANFKLKSEYWVTQPNLNAKENPILKKITSMKTRILTFWCGSGKIFVSRATQSTCEKVRAKLDPSESWCIISPAV